jgi:hypothetical protein
VDHVRRGGVCQRGHTEEDQVEAVDRAEELDLLFADGGQAWRMWLNPPVADGENILSSVLNFSLSL